MFTRTSSMLRFALQSTLTATTTNRAAALGGVRWMRVASRPSDLIGNTPLLDLSSLLDTKATSQNTRLFAKLESMGPCSSVKDRLGRSMIDQAEADGLIKPGETTLVEPTSGNTYVQYHSFDKKEKCVSY
jgi:hypothetical protein